ncbi:MAG: DNA polymerase III subunit, partial [Acidobacteriota bacterium]|nr:DNA polymerase III subunit [Acidobacteriota bacterium]
MFDSLKGNRAIKRLLERVVSEDRVPQALIFAGREGIGKKRFALEMARYFVCTDRLDGLPCGKCPACVRSNDFNLPTSGKKPDYEKVYFSGHPDIGMIVPNKNTIYVNAIRNLEEEAHYLPYEGRARVFIVDEAEKLGLSQKNAANALLKTLEEPPPTTHIILITSKPSTILQTIHSRCQTIRFSPINDSEIEDHLLETNEISTGDARLKARAAKGSIARAISIDLEDYRRLRLLLLESISSVTGATGIAAALKVSEELTGPKESPNFEENLEILQTLVRDLLM